MNGEAVKVDMLVWNTFQNDARVKNEAETLARAGYKVSVHALHAPGYTRKQEILNSGVEVMRHGESQGVRLLKPKKYTARRNGLELLMLMLSRVFTHVLMLFSVFLRRPDVVHAHDVNVLPTGWLAARLTGAKLVYDAHEISSGREGYRKIGRIVQTKQENSGVSHQSRAESQFSGAKRKTGYKQLAQPG